MSTATKLNDVGCAPVILRDDRKGSSAVDAQVQPALAQILALQEKAERHSDEGKKLLDAMEQLEDLIKMLQQLKQSGQATAGEMASLEQMIVSLKAKIDNSKDQLFHNLEQDADALNGANTSHNGICNSALVEVLRILRELQDKYTELGVLYNKVAQESTMVSSQVTCAAAEATKQGIFQEAYKEIVDGSMALVTTGLSGVSLVKNAKSFKAMEEKNAPLAAERDNLKLYQNALAKGPQVSAVVGADAPPPPPPLPAGDPILNRGEELGRGYFEPGFNDRSYNNQAAINHMDRDQLRLAKQSADSQHAAVIREINSNHETYNAEAGQRNLYKEMATGVFNAGTAGTKAYFDSQRGHDQAAATIAQGTQKQVDDMVNSNRSTGKDMVDQGIRLIDSEVQALLSANRPN